MKRTGVNAGFLETRRLDKDIVVHEDEGFNISRHTFPLELLPLVWILQPCSYQNLRMTCKTLLNTFPDYYDLFTAHLRSLSGSKELLYEFKRRVFPFFVTRFLKRVRRRFPSMEYKILARKGQECKHRYIAIRSKKIGDTGPLGGCYHGFKIDKDTFWVTGRASGDTSPRCDVFFVAPERVFEDDRHIPSKYGNLLACTRLKRIAKYKRNSLDDDKELFSYATEDFFRKARKEAKEGAEYESFKRAPEASNASACSREFYAQWDISKRKELERLKIWNICHFPTNLICYDDANAYGDDVGYIMDGDDVGYIMNTEKNKDNKRLETLLELIERREKEIQNSNKRKEKQ